MHLSRPAVHQDVRRHMKSCLEGCVTALLFAVIANSADARGTVLARQIDSPALGVTKRYRVYLPDGYETSARRYPVIYLLHGLGVTEDAWVAPSLDLPGTADELKLQAIVVMPDGDRSFYANSVTPTDYDRCLKDASPKRNKEEPRETFCVRAPRYEDYIISDLVPHVDKHFRTIAKREARALSGESGGGLGAMHLAIRHKDLFAVAASHSAPLALLYEGPHPYEKTKVKLRTSFDSYPPGLSESIEIFGTDVSHWRAYDPSSLIENLRDGELAIYFDCGEQDEPGFHDHAMFFHDRLVTRGIRHTYVSTPGKHHESLWKDRLRFSLKFEIEQFTNAGVYSGPAS
jgi:S-formylglutathione hydrolase FrmB